MNEIQNPINNTKELIEEAENKKTLTINLDEQSIVDESGKSIDFEIEKFKKKCLIEGLDDIGLTLKKNEAIDVYEERIQEKFPWIV